MAMIPFLDLRRQYESIRGEIDEAVATVMRRGRFVLGEEVEAFEREFAGFCGTAHAVGVGSGTEALHLALMAGGVGPGHEVVTVSYTAVATVAAVEMTGARPVFVDIDPRRHTLDPARLEQAVTPKTRAVIPVHLYGCPADLEPVLEIARRRGLLVIEDCAQAHGALYRDRPAGAWGHLAAFSFYPTKNLGAYGDGGAVAGNDSALIDRVRLLRQYGWKNRYISSVKGTNSRLDELQAAILRVKLRHLAGWNTQRRHLAGLYVSGLDGSGLLLPGEPPDTRHAWHLYVVRHPRRDDLQVSLRSQGIESLVHYPVPVHLQPAYLELGFPPGSLPATESAAREVLSLPLFAELGAEEVATVCGAVRSWSQSLPESPAGKRHEP